MYLLLSKHEVGYLCKNSAWESKQVVIILKEYSNNTYKCIGGSVMCRLLYWVLFKLTIDVFLIVTTHLQWKVDAVPVF